MLDEEEDRDIQAMILGDIEGIDAIEDGEEDNAPVSECCRRSGCPHSPRAEAPQFASAAAAIRIAFHAAIGAGAAGQWAWSRSNRTSSGWSESSRTGAATGAESA